MNEFADFSELPPITPADTVRDTSMYYLGGADGTAGGEEDGKFHQSEDHILALFLSRDDRARSCLVGNPNGSKVLRETSYYVRGGGF